MGFENRLKGYRGNLKVIIHACECSGCRNVECYNLRGLLLHVVDCHNGSQCYEYKDCYRLRLAIVHACNCTFINCKLCKGIVDGKVVEMLPKLESTVRDAEPGRIASMIGMDVQDLFDLERDHYVEVVELDDEEDSKNVARTQAVLCENPNFNKRFPNVQEVEENVVPPKRRKE
uniref:TAZ-type domain-containing protein n=1 Tax=Steinernema glaseri TaxID=37863 RepID=A0A1I7YUK2_9BILA